MMQCLKKLYRAGKSDFEISEAINRTVMAVNRRRSILGIVKNKKPRHTNGKWSEQETAQLRELVKTHSDKQISEIMGRTKGAVKLARFRLDNPSYPKVKVVTPTLPPLPKNPPTPSKELTDLDITRNTLAALGYKLEIIKI